MALSRRQKLTIISLLLYWPGIFTLTHIPLKHVPRWIVSVPVSDKTLHYITYLILIFLLWFAINPFKKVNWRKAAAWWILLVVVWYGVLDEWLQSYVGRGADVKDFFADLAGTLTGLILLSIFSFWSALLIVTGAAIFVLTNSMQAGLADQLPLIDVAFHFSAYTVFTLLWTGYIYRFFPTRPPEARWLIGALALPVGFLLAVEIFSAVAAGEFGLLNTAVSLAAIVMVIVAISLAALPRRQPDEA